jgi:hypothetical protein
MVRRRRIGKTLLAAAMAALLLLVFVAPVVSAAGGTARSAAADETAEVADASGPLVSLFAPVNPAASGARVSGGAALLITALAATAGIAIPTARRSGRYTGR